MSGLPDIGTLRSPSRLQPTWVARLEGWGGLNGSRRRSAPPHHEAERGRDWCEIGMTFEERLADILARMREAKLDAVVALHDGAHFIEKPNPVTVITGFKSLGPAAAVLRSDGETTLIVTPAWDAERAAEHVRRRAWSARTTLPTRWPLR